ncbi:MAG TPA: 50S ribosomal protein L23 [Verrucomicrobiales bacterium]|jgi:large subunit ribosomal protein L23|nr:50S ribosomal protein L23 [Verrucomicrobiales bacterium]
MRDIYSVIDNVRLSEKSTLLQETNNEYVFKVDRRANKIEIRRAVEQAFGVKVIGVRTANYSGKAKRAHRADQGKTASWKKAMVRLKDGDTIDLI